MTGASLYSYFYGSGSINQKLFMLVNHADLPLLDAMMPIITFLGGSRLFYAYFALLALLYFTNKRVMPGSYLLVYLVATFFALGVESLLKELSRVPRPPIAIGYDSVRVLGKVSRSFSLPSGHAVFSFMTAFVLSHGRSRWWKVPLFLFACLVAWSRST